MEILPADSSALVGYEPWRAWRVIGLSAAPARCAGHGVCSCVCADVCDCLGALPGVRFKTIYQKKAKFALIDFGCDKPIHPSSIGTFALKNIFS